MPCQTCPKNNNSERFLKRIYLYVIFKINKTENPVWDHVILRYKSELQNFVSNLYSPFKNVEISEEVQTWAGECELAKKCAINEKLSIFVQFWWNLVKMTTSWLGQIAKTSAWYNPKWGFFIYDTILSQFAFSCPCL